MYGFSAFKVCKDLLPKSYWCLDCHFRHCTVFGKKKVEVSNASDLLPKSYWCA
jgi:hypothetical protein